MKARRWGVVLKDGTRFLGLRTVGCVWWHDGLNVLTFIVDDPQATGMPRGALVRVRTDNLLYRYRLPA